MSTVRIDHPRNEASALLGVQNVALLEARGWDIAFWAASDEASAPDALAIIGRSAGTGEWTVEPLRIEADLAKRVEDCETISRAGSWIYVFGSQFGQKDGPLEPKRHFVMRFNEALISIGKSKIRTKAHVARRPFAIHRLVNDAITRFGVKLLTPGDRIDQEFIADTLRAGKKKKKSWRDLVREGDSPINVEGTTFLPGGHLVLGLRYPVSEGGHPILVEIEGIDRLFQGGRPPIVIAVRVLESAGSRSRPAGIRELDYLGGIVHAITGNLDSDASHSAIVDDHPEGARARSEHWAFPLALGARGAHSLRGRLVKSFPTGSVEGMALEGSHVWYVHDDEQIVLESSEMG